MKNYIKVKSKTEMSGFFIVYYGSTLNEKPGIYGISHLMEHLVCKGIDHLMEDLEKDGISWNAYTSDKEIVFYLTGLDEYVNKWKKPFYENILNFNITEEQFENEKKIVLAEYERAFNSQDESHSLNLYRKLFDNYGPIGLKQDLENLTLKDCKDYFQLQYTKPHKIIDVSKHKHIEDDYFEDIKYSNVNPLNIKLKYVNNDNFIYEKGNEYKKEASILIVSPIIEKDFPIIEFICKMLSGGLKSPLVYEVREKLGLVYTIGSYIHKITNKSSIFVISTETPTKNKDKVVETISKIMLDPEKYLTKERFDIVKQNFDIKFRKEKENQYINVNKWIDAKHFSLENILDELTYDIVLDVFRKHLTWEGLYKSIDINEFK